VHVYIYPYTFRCLYTRIRKQMHISIRVSIYEYMYIKLYFQFLLIKPIWFISGVSYLRLSCCINDLNCCVLYLSLTHRTYRQDYETLIHVSIYVYIHICKITCSILINKTDMIVRKTHRTSLCVLHIESRFCNPNTVILLH
jgi:hypothetical protein